MMTTRTLVDTPLATIQRSGTDLVEVRFKPGCVLNAAGIAAILDARQGVAVEGPLLVLIVFPQDNVDFEMQMITTDHYDQRPVKQHSRAVAWVTRNAHNERFTQLYFAYYPSPVPSAIFAEEEEARAWLATK